ncbi:MAG TPA: class I SAM-dependent methyltransferase [Polyangiaceae bacterium]|nr:class I SAM-dependent methyltransferase [Polyangiaceae bacterium]
MQHYLDAALYESTFRQRRHDIDYYVELARRSGGPVLEYGAGAGRVTLALARAGIEVVAVDKSQPMLDLLAERLGEVPAAVRARVRVVRGDMRTRRALGQFPLILATFNVVGHLQDLKDMQAFLARVREHLTDDGELVFDVPVPSPDELEADPDEPHRAPRFKHPTSGQWIRQTERFDYDAIRQVLTVDSEFQVEGRRDSLSVPLILRQWFPRELDALLTYEGFAQVRALADYTDQPALGDVDMLVMHASRRPRG